MYVSGNFQGRDVFVMRDCVISFFFPFFFRNSCDQLLFQSLCFYHLPIRHHAPSSGHAVRTDALGRRPHHSHDGRSGGYFLWETQRHLCLLPSHSGVSSHLHLLSCPCPYVLQSPLVFYTRTCLSPSTGTFGTGAWLWRKP